MIRSSRTRTSAPRRARLSRPVSRRATSSSSVISRLSRSASAWTVVSISSFCSSLRRVQRLSIAWTKPFTPVSGDRSSWATAATRSDRSRSRRARPRPERTETATAVGGPSGSSRRIRAVTRHSLPSGSTHDCSGTPVRVLGPWNGALYSSHVRPSLLVSENTSTNCAPTTFERSTPNSCSAARLTSTTVSSRSKMTTPSASASTASPPPTPRPAPYAELRLPYRRVAPPHRSCVSRTSCRYRRRDSARTGGATRLSGGERRRRRRGRGRRRWRG